MMRLKAENGHEKVSKRVLGPDRKEKGVIFYLMGNKLPSAQTWWFVIVYFLKCYLISKD